MHEANPLAPGFLEFELVSWHLGFGFQRDHGDLAGACPCSRSGRIDGQGGCSRLVSGIELVHLSGVVLGRPQRSPSCIHRHVASADHDHTLSHRHIEAPVHVDEELDGLEHPVRICSRDVQAPTEGRADRHEQGVVSAAELVERDVVAKPGVGSDLHSEIDDRLQVAGQDGPIQPVLGDTQPHGAAQLVGRFVDRHLVAEPA